MSIVGCYTVQCSWCDLYMVKFYNTETHTEDYTLTPFRRAASMFGNWAEAEHAAFEADWFDGHNGQLARCTCGKGDEFKLSRDHAHDCRKNNPRLVPIDPGCRAKLDEALSE